MIAQGFVKIDACLNHVDLGLKEVLRKISGVFLFDGGYGIDLIKIRLEADYWDQVSEKVAFV